MLSPQSIPGHIEQPGFSHRGPPISVGSVATDMICGPSLGPTLYKHPVPPYYCKSNVYTSPAGVIFPDFVR